MNTAIECPRPFTQVGLETSLVVVAPPQIARGVDRAVGRQPLLAEGRLHRVDALDLTLLGPTGGARSLIVIRSSLRSASPWSCMA